MNLEIVNQALVTRFFPGGEDTVIFFFDRVILSGTAGNQVFKCTQDNLREFCISFLNNMNEQNAQLAELHQEGTVNKERAISNVHKLPLSGSNQAILRDRIADCDCSPTAMRKKLRAHFGLDDHGIKILNLEDYSKEMENTLRGMNDFCYDYILHPVSKEL